MTQASTIGIMAIDDSSEREHEFYEVTEFSEGIYDALDRAVELQELSPLAHIELSAAMIKFGTLKTKGVKATGGETTDREKAEKVVLAFMGKDFDITDLGEWRKISQYKFNKLGSIKETYILISMADTDDIGRYS